MFAVTLFFKSRDKHSMGPINYCFCSVKLYIFSHLSTFQPANVHEDCGLWTNLKPIMHLSAANPGGWPQGTPRHLHQDICKFHLSRANILPQKATTVPPAGSNLKEPQIVT